MPKLSCQPMIGNRPVPHYFFDMPAEVRQVSGDWLWIGRAWVKKKDVVSLDTALAYYTDALRTGPARSTMHMCRGVVWKSRGNFNEALVDLNEAIRIQADHVGAYCIRGSVWEAMWEIDKALADYASHPLVDPSHPAAYQNRLQSGLPEENPIGCCQRT